MRYSYLLLLLCCFFKSPALTLSPDSEISILTCAPGSELYSLFGHTAIRVKDAPAQIDIVFNYGTFDFRTEHFYLKYAQGLLPYQLSVNSYESFINAYIYDDRSVWSQTLILDSLEKQNLFDRLLENRKPENRTYLYNFLFDNCSTRVRDMIEKSMPDKIDWQIPATDKSFWNLLDEYLYRMPWVKWGIHTILGQPGSRIATPYETMFLPDYLLKGLETASYEGHPLVKPTISLYEAPVSVPVTPWYFSPLFVFSLATLFIIVLLQYSKSVLLLKTIAFCLFITSGIIGLLLIFLGFFTEHPITAPNYNLIWANPLNIVAAFLLPGKKYRTIYRKYRTFYLIILCTGLLCWLFLSPAVPLASIPLILFMIYLCLKLKQREN